MGYSDLNVSTPQRQTLCFGYVQLRHAKKRIKRNSDCLIASGLS
jgi:hypothetical protein